MNAMTCADVVEQLDLLAAGVCEPATAEMLHQHLRDCPACASQFAASQHLMARLDAHLDESGLQRLQARIDAETRPTRRPRLFSPFIRRAMAAAALFLIATGLAFWLPTWRPGPRSDEPQFALLVQARNDQPQAMNKEALPAHALIARGVELRDRLRKAERDGSLPLPPAVALELTLVNESKRPVDVRFGDATTLLTLELPEEKVVRMPAPKAKDPAFLQPRTVELKPGEKHVLAIDRLIAGSPGNLDYIYVIEPGEFAVTASLRFTADGKAVVALGQPARVKIGE